MLAIWEECVTLTPEDAHNIYFMKKRKEYLDRHNHKIWKGKDGRYYTYFDDRSAKRGIRKKGRTLLKDLKDDIVQHYYEEEQEPTFEQVFYMWNNKRLEFNEIKKGTFDKLENDYHRFFVKNKWKCRKQKIKNITEDDLILLIESRIKDLNLTAKAYSNMRTIILGVYKFAKRKKFIKDFSITHFFGDLELSKSIFTKKAKLDAEQVFDEDETDLLIKYLSKNVTLSNYAILLGLVTGLTVGEVAALEPTDISKNGVTVNKMEESFKDPDTKKSVTIIRDFPKNGNRVRTVLVPLEFSYVLETLSELSGEKYLFEYRDGRRVRANNHNKKLREACKALGIRHRSWHKLRKTYGSALIDSGASDSTIESQMGHYDIRTTKEFYYRSRKSKEMKQREVNGLYKRA